MNLKNKIAISIASFCFGLIPIFGTILSGRGVSSFEQTFFMEVISFVILLPIFFKFFKQKTIEKRDLLFFSLFGLILFSVNMAPLTAIALGTPVAFISLVLYMHPVFTLFIGKLWFKEEISVKKVIFVIIALLGVFLVLGEGIDKAAISIVGVIIAVICALSMSLWSNFGKESMNRGYGAFDTLFYSAFGAVVLLFVSLLIIPNVIAIPEIGNFTLNLGVETFAILFALSFTSTVIGHTLFFYGIDKVSVITGSILALIEPVTSILLSVVLFSQALTPLMIVGGIIILIMSVLISLE